MKRIEEMNLWERVVTVQLACNKDPDSALLHPGYEECWKGLFTTKRTKDTKVGCTDF